MGTFEIAMLKNALGDGSVSVIDHEELSRQTAASAQQNKAERVDRRTPTAVTHELQNLQSNVETTERDRRVAESRLNELTGIHAKLSAGIRKYKEFTSLSDHGQALLAKAQKSLAKVEHELNDPRTGVKHNLDRLTRIEASRKKLVAEFLDSRPFDDAQTNREFLAQAKQDAEFEALIDEKISQNAQPSVGLTKIPG